MIWIPYEPEFWYFESLETVRRLGYTVASAVIPEGGMLLVLLVFLTCASLKAYGGLRPFDDDSDNLLAENLSWLLLAIYLIAIACVLRDDDTSWGVDVCLNSLVALAFAYGIAVVAADLIDEFERLCFGVVFLWRWNALRMYVSDKANHADRAASRKKKSTHDHQAHPQDAEALAFHQRHQVELLADARLKRHLLTILSSRREAADAWKERSRDSFSVYYEDLVAGAKLGNMMWTELQYFLGVWPRVLSTDLLPIHADIPLNYTVLNYAEVKVVLRHASKKELKKYLRPYDPEGHDATKLI